MQSELAHANRVATMGQLTASIAHEVNQPLAATRNNLNAALNFLDTTPPDLVEVREALACAAKDNDRASTVVGRIRALTQKAPTRINSVNINEVVRGVIELTYGEVLKNRISVRTQLAVADIGWQPGWAVSVANDPKRSFGIGCCNIRMTIRRDVWTRRGESKLKYGAARIVRRCPQSAPMRFDDRATNRQPQP